MHALRVSPSLPRSIARLLTRAIALCSAWLGTAAAAQACPDCAIGRAARRDVWSRDFGFHLAVALAPFAIMALVSAWADRLDGRKRASDG